MPDTRIILRNDTAANWAASGATDLNKGELAFVIEQTQSGDTTTYKAVGRLGVADDTPFGDCVEIASGSVLVTTGVAETETVSTKPVVYEDAATKPDGTTVRWDATNSKWVADAKVLTLDAYPTQNGTVVYDSSLGKFVVGAVVAATEIDGGTFS